LGAAGNPTDQGSFRTGVLKMNAMKLKTVFLVAFFITHAAWAAPKVVVDVSLTPAGDFKINIDDVTGHAMREGDTVRAENIVVNLSNLKTGLPLRDRHAKEKYLETDKYPNITLLRAVGKGGKGTARIKVRDVEKDIEGNYKIEGNELIADFPLKISDFNITGVKYLGVGVNDIVVVHATLPLK
jgi:polyisoprenoid-binding protein YceI